MLDPSEGSLSGALETTAGTSSQHLWRALIGVELRAIRRARGETLETVARRASLSLPYLSEVERGTKEVSSEVLAAICAAPQVTLRQLLDAVSGRLRATRSSFERLALVLAA